MNNKVVVIGGDHHNTLGIIESFGEKNIKTYAIILTHRKSSYVLHSKYIEEGWCCKDENSIVGCLLKNFDDTKNKAVLIATNDTSASILDDNFSTLSKFFYIPTTTPSGTLSNWMSKETMSELARKVNLNVPKTWIVTDAKIPSDIEYPVITKAISSVAGSKDNIKICKQESELKDFLNNQSLCPTIQIQKFIEKEFEFQFLGCSLNSGEDIIIPGRTNIDRPNGLDNTFFLWFDKYEIEFNDTVQKVKNFIKATGYTGLFSVEFLKDKNDGKSYFTEMNFRNDGNAVCVTFAGTNLPYILYLSMIGEDFIQELKNSSVKRIYLMPEFYYFQCLLAREFGLGEWRRNMKLTNCYTTYFKNDKKPFKYFLLQKVNRIFEKILNK